MDGCAWVFVGCLSESGEAIGRIIVNGIPVVASRLKINRTAEQLLFNNCHVACRNINRQSIGRGNLARGISRLIMILIFY